LEIRAKDLQEVQEQALVAARFRADHAAQIRAARSQYLALLEPPAGPDEDDDEQAAVAQEYHPQEQELSAATVEKQLPPRTIEDLKARYSVQKEPDDEDPPIEGDDLGEVSEEIE
jgi:capsid protein